MPRNFLELINSNTCIYLLVICMKINQRQQNNEIKDIANRGINMDRGINESTVITFVATLVDKPIPSYTL